MTIRTGLWLTAVTALFAVSCAPPSTNTSNASNTGNASTTSTAAPTAESFMEMERRVNQAFINGDTKVFEEVLSPNFVAYHEGQRYDRSAEIKMVGSVKCNVKDWKLDQPQMIKIDDSTYLMAYHGTWDGDCAWNGSTMKIPSPVRAATVWIRSGDKWQAAYHGETAIIDPAASSTPVQPSVSPASNSNTSGAGSNSNTSPASAASPTTPVLSANTDALVKLHTQGWEAFKAKDANWFNDHLTNDFVLIDPVGGLHTGKARSVTLWTETMKCEGVTTVALSDGGATALSPTVELLTVKGTADGTCNGQKNGPLYQSALYVKQGDTWKLAFMHESPVS
jgi:ketosteroid isomerase-like protein